MPDQVGITIPRLSKTLRPIVYPHRCQRCDADGTLTVWREHDDADRPEMIFVVLCIKCAGRIIEPHPRLYAQMNFNEPAPGIMRICANCAHQAGGRCGSPIAQANGGPGLRFPGPDSTVHVQRAGPKGRRRRCEWMKMWNEEAKECQGFEERKEAAVASSPA